MENLRPRVHALYSVALYLSSLRRGYTNFLSPGQVFSFLVDRQDQLGRGGEGMEGRKGTSRLQRLWIRSAKNPMWYVKVLLYTGIITRPTSYRGGVKTGRSHWPKPTVSETVKTIFAPFALSSEYICNHLIIRRGYNRNLELAPG